MAGVIKAPVSFMVEVAKGKSVGALKKKYPFCDKAVLQEARENVKDIVELPSGEDMLRELQSLTVEARELMEAAKANKDIPNALSAIRTSAKLVDSFSKVYEIAARAYEKKQSVTQQEFDTLVSVLQRVLSRYPDVMTEFALELERVGLEEKSKNFAGAWDEYELEEIE